MSIYAIGDIQGCYDELQELLSLIGFDAQQDQLWLCGDLVNRGRQSLEVLRFVRDLGERAICVLGNHDLHLLAVHAGVKTGKQDTLDAVLNAPDVEALIHWLRHRPMLHHSQEYGYTLVHAGLAPQWNLTQAMRVARELESVLRGDDYRDFLKVMYGDQPRRWRADLTGWERLRFICNCFTRLRYCDLAGRLVLSEKGPPGQQASGHVAWFEVPERESRELRIIFGHWSTLGLYHVPGIYALDSGCVWGGQLTAMRLDTDPPSFHSVHCRGAQNPLDYLNAD